MNVDEYTAMAEVERVHWFYRGKRALARQWLEHLVAPSPETELLDCGCGTGLFAKEMSTSCRVTAVDDHEEALSLARRNLSPEHCFSGSATILPFPDAAFDAVTALDVLEHIQDDKKALAEWKRVLRPGGVLLLTVPALQSLWSDWDVALHHYRRYDRAGLEALIAGVGLELISARYTNTLLVPFFFVARRVLNRLPGFRQRKLEHRIPPRWVNSMLEFQYVKLGRMNAISLPFGTSLIAAGRKQ